MILRTDSASGYRITAIATLAAAAAGITFLSGLLDFKLRALVSLRAIPDASWAHTWSRTALTPQAVQSHALDEWLRLVLLLLAALLTIAGISALVSLFAHATARRYEVALSAVVGASRRQLIAVQLVKAAANAGLAMLLGIPLGMIGALAAQRAWPHERGGLVLLWLAVAMLICCALAALVARSSAARMARVGWLGDVLAPEARSNPGYGAEDLRGALLQVQFAFTFALLAVALLVWQQSRQTASQPDQRAKDGYVTRVELKERPSLTGLLRLERTLEQQHAVASPGALIGVGKMDHVIANCGACSFGTMALPLFRLRTQQHVIGGDFFALTSGSLQQGREFEPGDAAQHHIVVNDTFASLAFQGQPAVGKQVLVGGIKGTWYTVIGVVHDVPITALHSFRPDEASVVRNNRLGHEPAIYFYAREKPPAVFDVISARPLSGLAIAGARIEESVSITAALGDARAPTRWFATVLAMLAFVAALVAVLSLAAMTMLNVRQREGEIAARRAVGARRADILSMVLRASSFTVLRGSLSGMVLSVALARAVQMILPEIKLLDARVLSATIVLLAVVSLIAALLPARSAAAIPPARVHA